MLSDFWTNLTLITSFLCMALSLWFAIYLLARSFANPLTFRAIVTLLALTFYFNNSFADLVNPNTSAGPVRSLATLIVLIAGHDLTHYLLPQDQRRRLYWVTRAIVLMGVVAIALLFSAPPVEDCDPGLTCPANLSYPWIVIDLFRLLVFSAIVYNLWLIRKSESRLQNVALFGAFFLSTSTIAYSILGTVLNVSLPRLIPNLVILFALGMLIYSVVREQTFVTSRSAAFDLPITLLTITAIVGLYVLTAMQFHLSPTGTLLLAMLAIFTHSAYDFVRESIDRLFRRQEHSLREELRQLRRNPSPDATLPRFLGRGLAILCNNLRASAGLIALCQGDEYEVIASLNSLPVGKKFSAKDVSLDGHLLPSIVLLGNKYLLAPAFAGSEQVALVGVAARKDHVLFEEEEVYWLEDIADEMGWMIHTQLMHSTQAAVDHKTQDEIVFDPEELALEADELLTRLAYKPDPELVKSVEESFRNLNDYSKLGKSSLTSIFGIRAEDHIEGGKLVQQKLIEILEKLRPPGKTPCEPLSREWYAYTILHDAYVEEKLSREIMAKLYISEGTYYRLRRNALRGITRVILETHAVASP